MSTDYYYAVGAFLKVKLEKVDIPAELWDCGNKHIASPWDRGIDFCHKCGQPVRRSIAHINRCPQLMDLLGGDAYEVFDTPEYEDRRQDTLYLLSETGECHEHIHQGFSTIDHDDLRGYVANFASLHNDAIEHIRNQPGVISAEIVSGTLGHYS